MGERSDVFCGYFNMGCGTGVQILSMNATKMSASLKNIRHVVKVTQAQVSIFGATSFVIVTVHKFFVFH